MPEYTVKDRETGQTITFRWDAPEPPTEADLAEVFRTARAEMATSPDPTAPPMMDVIDRLQGWLPNIGQAAGSMVGGIPGAVSGAMIGTAAGTMDVLNRLLEGGLTAVGGTVGGFVGGAAGSVPGAIGGAILGGAGGEGIRQAVQTWRGKEAPRNPGEALTDIGQEAVIQGGSEALGGAVMKGAGAAARGVYRGYLKPSLSNRLAPKANQIVQTALDEALPISRGGVATANRVIGELRQEVDHILATSKGTVDLQTVGDRIRAFAKARYFRPGADLTDYQQALTVADKIDQHPAIVNPFAPHSPAPVSLPDANAAKQALDTSVKEAGFGVPTGAKKSAEKFGRHALREELERAAPAIAPLNARESKLIEAAKTIARAVEREANQNQLYGVKSLTSAMGGGAAIAAGVDPVTATAGALASRAALHPAVASRAAIVAHRLQKELGIGAASAARLAAYVLSDQSEQDQ